MTVNSKCPDCGSEFPPDAPEGQCPTCLLKLGFNEIRSDSERSSEPAVPVDEFASRIGRHEVIRLIGSGGMGSVYEAWDPQLKRRVALKVLHPHLMIDEAHRGRILQEARLAVRADHDGVVRVFNVHDHDGMVVIEMQYVEGTPLNRLMAEKPLAVEQVKDLLRQVLTTLATCHERGVIHCDIKAANLMVTGDGKVLLTDFGISRAFQTDDSRPSLELSMSATGWGTPLYWPPEAWEGESPSPTWDLYALGVLAYQAVSGAPPFSATTLASLMREKLDSESTSILERVPDLEPPLASLIDSLASNRKADRPASANAALEVLQGMEREGARLPHESPLKHTPIDTADESRTSGLPLTARGQRNSDTNPGKLLARQRGAWLALALSLVLLTISVAITFRPDPGGRGTLELPPLGHIAPVGAEGTIADLCVSAGVAFFSYDDGWRGRELWRVDRSRRASMVSDINPGAGSSNPRWFLPRAEGGGLVMNAQTPGEGEELWYCSGSSSYLVKLVKDIIPGPKSSEPVPLASVENVYLFYARTLQHGKELWVTNSREQQTGLLKDIEPGAADSVPVPPHILADDHGMYFAALGSHGNWDLWRYSYDEGTTKRIAEVGKVMGEMALLGETLFLVKPDPELGMELWTYDPSNEQMQLVADVCKGPESSDPSQLFVWRNELYFQAHTRRYGRELWKTDGTADGTIMVKDVGRDIEDGAPYAFFAVDDRMFFRGQDNSTGNELWVTDGTTEGTRLFYDTLPGLDSSHPYNLFTIGGYLFYTADDGVHGEELWGCDLNDPDAFPRLIGDIRPGPESSEPHDFVNLHPDAGVFIYWMDDGQALMYAEVENGEVKLTPVSGLHRLDQEEG